VVFAERAGEVVGFGVALPDLNVALKHNPSGRLFPGIIKVLMNRKTNRRPGPAARRDPRVPRPRDRRPHVRLDLDPRRQKGYNWGEGGWILEDNAPMNNAALALGFKPYKTYRVYDKAL